MTDSLARMWAQEIRVIIYIGDLQHYRTRESTELLNSFYWVQIGYGFGTYHNRLLD